MLHKQNRTGNREQKQGTGKQPEKVCNNIKIKEPETRNAGKELQYNKDKREQPVPVIS